ncbi:MAG: hydroxymethylbilane synthase [Planctomycetota bacterium]|nr:hydroxymethylbilane synthase [Planctomycetota bacterium]
MKVFTVATRGGELAVAQTKIVIGSLEKIYPDIQFKITKVTTRGDRDRRTALWNLKDSGFFTSQLENALLAGKADLAVHSFKDLPTRQQDGLTIAAVCDRRFIEDCLVATDAVGSIEQLPHSAKIGTSSLRRVAQIKHLRADLKITAVRGNVKTRIRRLDKGEVDAIILARAGIERLGLGQRICFCFDPVQFIPAPAQGALAVQTRSDDVVTNGLVAAINDKNARMTTFAERQVLVTMQCGCHAPVGAFAKIVGKNIEIHAFISDLAGKTFIKRFITGPIADALTLAQQLANDLLSSGGKKILAYLEK